MLEGCLARPRWDRRTSSFPPKTLHDSHLSNSSSFHITQPALRPRCCCATGLPLLQGPTQCCEASTAADCRLGNDHVPPHTRRDFARSSRLMRHACYLSCSTKIPSLHRTTIMSYAAMRLSPRSRSTPISLGAIARDSSGSEPSPGKGRARVTVRTAKEADFEGVAKLRAVIVPVGMDGASGLMGSKVAIKDPVEAKRRRLMAKVSNTASPAQSIWRRLETT